MSDTAAIELIKRAIQLDGEQKYSDALTCYSEGIRMLLIAAKDIPSSEDRKREAYRQKVAECMDRAEKLKDLVDQEKGKMTNMSNNILGIILCILQCIIFIHGQNAIEMPPKDFCVGILVTLTCPTNNSVVIVRSAFYGITKNGTCSYTTGDCIADGMSSISCMTDYNTCNFYATKKKLPQCNDEESSYFHIEYDCIPIVMDDTLKEYDICKDETDITSDHGIIRSPGYPTQVQPTTNECLRAIHIPDNKTLRLWLSDLYIGSTSTNCADDHVYVVDNIQTFKYCGQKRHAYPYLCSSTILIQYLIKTDLSIYRGMRLYFEIIDRPINDNCPTGTVTSIPISTITATTIEPGTTTEPPAYAQLGIASPTQSFQICSSQTHTIECPNTYAVAIITNILGVTSSGQCESHDATKHCVITIDQLITCRQTCSFQYAGNQIIPSCNFTVATYQYIEYQCIPTNTHLISPNTSCTKDDPKTIIPFDRNGRFQSYNYPKLTQTNCTYRLETKPGNIIHIYALDISLNNFISNCDTNLMTLIEDNESQGTQFCEQRTYSLIYSSCSNELDLHYNIENETYILSKGINLYIESQIRPSDWHCGTNPSTTTNPTSIETTPTTPQATSMTTGAFINAMEELEYDICHGQALNYVCPLGYTFIIIDAFYGVKSQPTNRCGYVTNDCIQEATTTITQCQIDSPNCYLPYINKRRLAHCSDQYADYLHITHQCIPSYPTTTPSSLSEYNVCDKNSSSIRNFNGIITSPKFSQYVQTNDECKIDIFGVHDRLLKIWLNELSIASGGQRNSNDLLEEINQPNLIIYKTNEFDDIEQMYPSVRDACINDYFIINTRLIAYIFCGKRKLSLEPICTSSATIQYKTTTPDNVAFKGFKLYFEWVEKPVDVTCSGTPGTIDPSLSTTTPAYELLPIWAQNLDISPLFSKHICVGTTDSIKCPRSNDYVIAIENTLYGVTTTGVCDFPTFSDCIQSASLSLTCTHTCVIEYIVPKPLSHCQNQTANYLSIDYECIPTRLANNENPIDICSSTSTDTIALDKGLMISPKYPSLNSAHTCTKTIETVSSKIWMIYIVDLFLENEDDYGNCLHGSLTIFDGNDIRIICGLQQPQLVLFSCSNIVRFSFQSHQQALGYRGFKVYFKAINVPAGWACQPTGFSTTTKQTTIPTSPPTTLYPPTLRIAAYGGTITGNTRQYCQFPFTYQGNSNAKCIDENPPNATVIKTDSWCSLTSNYDTDHQWGFCDIGVTDPTYYDICRSESQRLQCPSGYVIDIVTADYAGKEDESTSCTYDPTDCFQSDIFSVHTQCAGKMSCIAYHFSRILTSCRNRFSAYLRIQYTCVPESIAEINTYDMCNNDSKLQDGIHRGFISSPNFPNTPNNLDCTFVLQPSKSRQNIYLYIVEMNLNDPNILGESCTKDRLITSADTNQRETCGLSYTNLIMKTCHAPLSIKLIRTSDARGTGVKLYFEFRDRPLDEICDEIITPSTPSTLIPTSPGSTTKPSPPDYFPNPSNRMVKTLCHPDLSGAFGAKNFQCPSNYILVIHRAFYGTGDRCAFTPGDCTFEADNVYRDCAGKQACSVSYENIIASPQCDQEANSYLSIEYQCLPTLSIDLNINDICINKTNQLTSTSGILKSTAYPIYNKTECVNITLISPANLDLVIHLYLLDLNIGVVNVETGLCSEDYILLSYQCNGQLYDQYLCGTRQTELLFSTCSPTDKIYASYNLTDSNSQSYRGFAFLYHLLPKSSVSTQSPIPTTDKSDTTKYEAIIGGIIGGLLFVVLCVSGFVYYRQVYLRPKTTKEQTVKFKSDEDTVQESVNDENNEPSVSIPPKSLENPAPMTFTNPFYTMKTPIDNETDIKDGSIGNSYEKLFKRFFDDTVTHITIQDPYIRAFHQICNFLRFCEAAIKLSANIKRIDLITSFETNEQAKQIQIEQLNQFKEHLAKKYSIDLTIKYVTGLHDREIRIDNGWIIKIGRGLDFYKPPECKLSIGYYDLDLRPCHQTTIDIFHAERVQSST